MMRTLNKLQIMLPLVLVAVCIFAFFNDHIFPFIYSSLSSNSLHADFYKACFVTIASTIIVFLIIKQNRQSARNLQIQYHNFFEENPIPMAIACAATNKFVAVNKATIDVYGYSQNEFSELSISDIRVKKELELMHEDLKTMNYGLGKKETWQHRKKNGKIILVEISSREIIFKNKKCRLLLALNITEIVKAREEKRIAEEEKIKQQNFTSYVVENFPVDVAVFDKDHRYILLNKTAVKDDAMRKWMMGKDDFDYFRRKGTGLNIAEERRERFLKAIAGKSEEWIDEHVVDGKVKYVLRKFYPYYEEGELKYVYGYGTDITEVKNAQLQRDEYIALLEKIAFTTSHRLRQPICNLQGLISLLEMEKIESRDINNIITCMQNSVSSMDEFTRDLGVKLHEYKQNLAKEREKGN